MDMNQNAMDHYRRTVNELAAIKLQQRLTVRPGCESTAAAIIQGAASGLDPLDGMAIERAVGDLQTNNGAVFSRENRTPGTSAMTAQERAADLKAKGLI
jgi:hypothetical protein